MYLQFFVVRLYFPEIFKFLNFRYVFILQYRKFHIVKKYGMYFVSKLFYFYFFYVGIEKTQLYIDLTKSFIID